MQPLTRSVNYSITVIGTMQLGDALTTASDKETADNDYCETSSG